MTAVLTWVSVDPGDSSDLLVEEADNFSALSSRHLVIQRLLEWDRNGCCGAIKIQLYYDYSVLIVLFMVRVIRFIRVIQLYNVGY